MNEFNYSNIEVISDQVMSLGQDAFIKMNVKLGRKNPTDNSRVPFMKGYVVPKGNKYMGTVPELVSIKRYYDYYLSIEKWNSPDFYIQIRPQKMLILRSVFTEAASKWIMKEDIWAIHDKKLIIKNRPASIIINDMQPQSKVVRLDPIVMEYMTGEFSKGIRLSIDGVPDFIDMTPDIFMGMVYIFNSIDMYNCAVAMLNSIPIYQEPLFVKQLIYIDDNKGPEDVSEEEGVKSVNRKIGQKKSFFDDN